MIGIERAPLQRFIELRDEYAAITTDDPASRFGEVQERYRQALVDVGWTVPEGECPLPLRCPARRYCTQFLEGGQIEPCGWFAQPQALGRRATGAGSGRDAASMREPAPVCRPGKPVHALRRYPDGVAVCLTCREVVEFPGREGEPPSQTWARWKDAWRAAHG
jgi:hypothetical protein